jgi:hypothetical protein
MGLVTPMWEPAEVALPDPLTRMTLTLLDKLDYAELLSQFHTLPDTFLLFLNKLGAVTIDKIEFAGKSVESTTFSCTLDESPSQATLSKVYRKGSEHPRTSLKHYQITRKTVKGLARDEHRDCNTAEVVLEFPLDGQSEPIIAPRRFMLTSLFGTLGFP